MTDVGPPNPRATTALDRPGEQPGELAGVSGEHRDPCFQVQLGDEALEVVRACRPAVDEDDTEIMASPGDHQARNPAAAAEIDHHAGDAAERFDKRFAVGHGVDDRGAAEHAETLRRLERLDERCVRTVDVPAASTHAGLTMIRRCGSSPSERLTTPSMVVSVSWTTLRSDDGIGSSERATPDSLTRSATSRANRSRAARRFSR